VYTAAAAAAALDDPTVSPFSKQERRIVRLRKCDGADGGEGEDVLAEREREHVWREAVFCRGVMVPLLGDCYIQPPTAACMDRAEVKRLDQMLRTQRPGNLCVYCQPAVRSEQVRCLVLYHHIPYKTCFTQMLQGAVR
jgi:hypothetical protein